MIVARSESPTEWRLTRADGAFVAVCRNTDGAVDRILIGGGTNPDLTWRGRVYQEAMWGSASANGDCLLLVGHVAGGYVSAALTLDADRLTMEFADRVAAADDELLATLTGLGPGVRTDEVPKPNRPANARMDAAGRVLAARSSSRGTIAYAVHIDFADDKVRSVRVA